MFYLYSVGVICRVLEETVVWIENLSRKEEKEFSGRTSVVQALFPREVDVEPRLGQLLLRGGHDLVERIFQEVIPSHH